MNETSVKTYDIDGTIYEQRPLVFGQLQQLNRIIDDVEMPEELTPRRLVGAFSDRLDQILAVILTEHGKKPQDKDLSTLADHLAFAMSPEQVAKVIADFFDCTPIASILNLVTGVVEKLRLKVETVPTGSNALSSSSPTEIGPSATASSGNATPPSQAPG